MVILCSFLDSIHIIYIFIVWGVSTGPFFFRRTNSAILYAFSHRMYVAHAIIQIRGQGRKKKQGINLSRENYIKRRMIQAS
jgi:hypothetical protein